MDGTRSIAGYARRVVVVGMIATIVSAGACSTTTPPTATSPTTGAGTTTAAPATDTTPTTATTVVSGTTPTTRTTGTTAGTPSGTRAGTSSGVESITIAIDDPTAGHLVFDAIAAGDPAQAKAGKLVLLLHGFPETDEAWREQLEPLAAAGYYAVAPNQRGYSPGARPAGIEPYAVPSLVADVLSMATALGAETFHVVGHDWGAAVAWSVAGAQPARVTSLVAVSVPHPDAFAAAFSAADGEQTKKSGYMDVFRAAGSEDRFTANGGAGLKIIWGKQIPPAKVDTYLRTLGTPEALGAALNWYRATSFTTGATLGKVHVPTMFIWSTNDVAIARSGAEATKDHVDGPYRFEVLEGISHWIPEESPDRLRELLAAHLASLS